MKRKPEITKEDLETLAELMQLVTFIRADKDMPDKVIRKQPEHVTGFVAVGKN